METAHSQIYQLRKKIDLRMAADGFGFSPNPSAAGEHELPDGG